MSRRQRGPPTGSTWIPARLWFRSTFPAKGSHGCQDGRNAPVADLRTLMSIALFVGIVRSLRASTGDQEVPPKPSYQRHVAALFSRLGCNGGTCHGAVKGQNGFRLSLFGADPRSTTNKSCATSAAAASIATIRPAACCSSRRPGRSITAAVCGYGRDPSSTRCFSAGWPRVLRRIRRRRPTSSLSASSRRSNRPAGRILSAARRGAGLPTAPPRT